MAFLNWKLIYSFGSRDAIITIQVRRKRHALEARQCRLSLWSVLNTLCSVVVYASMLSFGGKQPLFIG